MFFFLTSIKETLLCSKSLILFTLFYTACVNHYHVKINLDSLNLLLKYLPFLSISVALLLVPKKRQRWVHFFNKNRGFVFLYFLYVAISFISALFGQGLILGLSKLVYFSVTSFCMTFLMYNVGYDSRSVNNLLNVFLVAGVLVSLAGIITKYWSVDILLLSAYSSFSLEKEMFRTAGSLGNPVVYGSFLTMLVPFFLFKLIDCFKKMIFFFATCAGMLCVMCGIVISGSRMPIMLMFFSFIVMFFIFLRIKPVLTLFLFTLMLLLSLILSVDYTNSYIEAYKYDTVTDHIFERFNISNISTGLDLRLNRYLLTWEVFKEHPLLGIGFGNFTSVFEQYQGEWLKDEGPKTIDNQFLMLVVETGLLGLISFITVLLSILSACIFLFKYTYNSYVSDQMLSYSFLLFTISVLGLMMTWDTLNHPSIRIYFWAIVGLILSKKSMCTKNV